MSRVPRPRPDVEVFAEISIIDQLATNRVERLIAPGLSSAGLAVLNHFARVGSPGNPARLAGVFHVTKGAMTNTLQRLEAMGLVTVDVDPDDRRRKIVALTPAGAQAQRAAMEAIRPHTTSMRGAFADADFEAALPFLRRLRAWLAESGG